MVKVESHFSRVRGIGFGVACLGLLMGACASRGPLVESGSPETVAEARMPAGATGQAPVEDVQALPAPEPIVFEDEPPAGELGEAPSGNGNGDGTAPVPEDFLEAALEAYKSAGELWDEGAIEDALAALEQAFGFLLEVPEGESALIDRQREDLRRLIARRIVDVYASRQTAARETSKSIPILRGEEVEREIRSFQTGEREFFLASYRRSGYYRPMILDKLRAAGLPEELSWLPLIESGFKTRARSRAAAVGLWQFIASTGYRFGLSRDRWIDERMDPEKSTDAAIAYLTELHGLYGDWATALAAYNCGEGRVSRLIRGQRFDHLDHFWDLYRQLPRETRRYVPRFFAALLILEDPERYGITLPEPAAPPAVRGLEVDRRLALADVDRKLGLPSGTLAALNPELRHNETPPAVYRLRVPAASGVEEATLASLVRSLDTPRATPEPSGDGYRIHRVRRGESLAKIAAKYGTSVSQLQRTNGIRNRNRIHPGQRLRIPATATASSRRSAPTPRVAEYRVRRGDTLSGIANRHGTTVAALQRLNGLRSRTRIYPGQTLKITDGRPTVHVVGRGDTLWGIARRYGTRVSSIMRENGLNSRTARRLRIGQRLKIPSAG